MDCSEVSSGHVPERTEYILKLPKTPELRAKRVTKGKGVYASLKTAAYRKKSRNLLDNYAGHVYAPTARFLDRGQALCNGPSQRRYVMTKAEIVDQVAATVQLPKHQTDAVITRFLQAISLPDTFVSHVAIDT
jgi:hypothetical protein